MRQNKISFLFVIATVCILYVFTGFGGARTIAEAAIVKQSTEFSEQFSLPPIVPEDLMIRVDGDRNMNAINQALKQKFQQEYPGTEVEIDAHGREIALKALLRDEIDLAALSRPLTASERAQGFREIRLSDDKIAIIIGRGNSFTGSLTLEQLAGIIRGDITDWSDVGGAPGAIRFIDRPANSDTRLVLYRYLSRYGLSASAPSQASVDFQAVSKARRSAQVEGAADAHVFQLEQDDTAAVIRALGRDGISYAIASQVETLPQVKVVKVSVLLEALPSDSIYPYAQPRGYAYRRDNDIAVQSFLGFSATNSGQKAVSAGLFAEVQSIIAALSPKPIAATDNSQGLPIGLWWLLPLGGVIVWIIMWWQRQFSTSMPVGGDALALRQGAAKRSAGGELFSAGQDIELSPQVVRDRMQQGYACLSRQQYEHSLDIFAQILSSQSEITEAWLGKGYALIQLDRFQEAIHCFEHAVELAPTQPQGWLGQGIASVYLNRMEAAILHFQKVIDLGTTQPSVDDLVVFVTGIEISILEMVALAWSYSGIAQAQLNQSSLAIPSFDKSLELVPDYADTLVIKGQALLILKQIKQAMVCFERAIELDANQVQAWIYKGYIQLYCEQYEAALVSCEQAIQVQSEQPLAWLYKGEVLVKLGRTTDALSTFERAVQLCQAKATLGIINPFFGSHTIWLTTVALRIKALTNQGNVLVNLGRFDEAKTCFDTAIQLKSEHQQLWPSQNDALITEAWTGTGHTLIKLEQSQAALACFDTALQLDPNHPQPVLGKGLALLCLDQSEAAIEHFERVISLRDHSSVYKTVTTVTGVEVSITELVAIAWRYKGIAQLNLSLIKLAIGSFNKSLEMIPNQTDTLIAKGQALLILEQPQEAMICFDRVIKLQPENVQAWIYRSQALMTLKKFEEALDCCEQMLQSNADVPLVWLCKGEAQISLDRAQEAMMSFEQAIQLNQSKSIADWGEIALIKETALITGSTLMAKAWTCKGNALILMNEPEKALTNFDKAANQCADDPQLWLSRGNVLMNLGRLEEGLSSFNQAATLQNQKLWSVLTAQEQQTAQTSTVSSGEVCCYYQLTVDSQKHCYVLDPKRMQALQTTRTATQLEPGAYVVKIDRGSFSYHRNGHPLAGEPWVLLWLYGGKFINKKTNITTGYTWTSLNSYDDTLSLTVLETTTLCPLFVDPYGQGNSGQVNLSILQTKGQTTSTPQMVSSLLPGTAYVQDYVAGERSSLYALDLQSGQATLMGAIVTEVTDIAFVGGQLYGIATKTGEKTSQLISIDPKTGKDQIIGDIGFYVVGLAYDSTRDMLYASAEKQLIAVDRQTGVGRPAMTVAPKDYKEYNCGEVAFDGDGTAYISLIGYDRKKLLARCDLTAKTSNIIGDIGFPNLASMEFYDGILYGVAGNFFNLGQDGQLLRIDINTGAGTLITSTTPLGRWAGLSIFKGRTTEISVTNTAVAQTSSHFRRLTMDSTTDCYVLDSKRIRTLQTQENTIQLDSGSYVLRINKGEFSCSAKGQIFKPEPWVMLWLHGGKFSNQKTSIDVECSWSSLNGYNDTLTLEVKEPMTVCGLFLEAHEKEHSGQISLSILRDQ